MPKTVSAKILRQAKPTTSGQAVKPIEEAKAKERQAAGKGTDGSGGRGKKKNLEEKNLKDKRAPQTRDKVGAFAGYSGRTMEKIAAAKDSQKSAGG